MTKPTGRPNGRPPKFNNCMDMAGAIELYFEDCWTYTGDGAPEKQTRPYTMTGLANSIGMTRQAVLDYAKKSDFLATIKKARSKCEQYAEESLYNGRNVAGAIFNLKNNYDRWADKQDIAHTGNLSGAVVIVTPEYVGDNAKDD